MSEKGQIVKLLFVVVVLFAVLSACASQPEIKLKGYDYRGIAVGDTKEAIIDALGDPEYMDKDEGGIYSSLSYKDSAFLLKENEIISITIFRAFTLPSGVTVDDTFAKAIEIIGEDGLLQEPDQPRLVYQLLKGDYAIEFSFAEEEDVLYEDSNIKSITISNAKEALSFHGIELSDFKDNLVPVKYHERTVANESAVLQSGNTNGLTVLDVLKDFWKTDDNTTYFNFTNSTDNTLMMSVCMNGKMEQYTGAITLNGADLLSVIIDNQSNSTKSHIENYEMTEDGHVIRDYSNGQIQRLIPSTEEQFISCSNAVQVDDSNNEIKYSQHYYGRWVRVDVIEEDNSIYIELDEWDRGVLEFNNEGESLSYMIYVTDRSEEGTLAEYEDENGITHQVSLTIQNDKLLMAIDSEFVGAYERVQ